MPTRRPCFAYVGSRTSRERNGHGKGLTVARIDPRTGDWTEIQVLDDLVNPSFLCLGPEGKCLYTVHGDSSEVSAFRRDPETGRLTFLNRQSTKGKNPVHLSFDASKSFLVVANYATGSVVTLPVASDGTLGEVLDLIELPGEPGPHKIEQKGSHPHEVMFDPGRRFLFVPDKGLDRIFVLTVDPAFGKLAFNATPSIQTREGAGPRHIVFHPTQPFAYVVNELDSTVATYAWDRERGELHPIEVVPATPSEFVGNNRSAEIAISASGQHVYVSNRGHDSIGLFAIDSSSGRLSPVAWTSTDGRGPRFFASDLSEDHFYAANELTDSIVELRRTRASGMLVQTGRVIESGTPVCILFAPA
ncbi:hypothetical protein GCM10011611_02620 [Aliidongia dinghuensis]|uniref:Lactonase family protein n=2 Tax=Aliidongia dinghuensis TaxID=1867774 RepID=A0A8J2YQE3_9PROT|nr:hypothetical protein GCM10011611_02620 [Aliidongia dinghuensis]